MMPRLAFITFLCFPLWITFRDTGNDRKRPPETVAGQVAIMEAILTGDGAQAAELVRAPLAAGKHRVLNVTRFPAL